jgi:hypothetical protein
MGNSCYILPSIFSDLACALLHKSAFSVSFFPPFCPFPPFAHLPLLLGELDSRRPEEVWSIRFEEIANEMRGDVTFDCISHHQVTVLVPLITLKAAERVVSIRNVISILFQQQCDISKG